MLASSPGSLGPRTWAEASRERDPQRVAPGRDALDQVVRPARFKAAHPEVVVGDGGFGTMQARIPEPDGEIVTTRYTLRSCSTSSTSCSPRPLLRKDSPDDGHR